MKITFLGTGTSQGIPVIACDCTVCTSADKRDHRLRASILIETEDTAIVIDSGPDFRYQMLRAGVKKLDAILFTHEHKDHIAGLDDIRAFNYKQNKEIDIYADERVQIALRREYSYIFKDSSYPGLPQIKLIPIENDLFYVNEVAVQPVEVLHYRLPVFGFRINDFTYITDAKTISKQEKEKIVNSKILVLNALRKEDHISHFTLQEAIRLVEEVRPDQAYFIHMSHQMGLHAEIEKELPPHIRLAWDGLTLEM